MLRWWNIWPSIRDRKKAELVAKSAAKWYFVAAALSAVFGAISLTSGTPLSKSSTNPEIVFSGFSLVDAGLFALIAIKIRSMSFGWSVTGLVVALLGVLLALGSGDLSPIS